MAEYYYKLFMAKYKTTIEVNGIKVLTTWYDDQDDLGSQKHERQWKRYNVSNEVWSKALLELNLIAFEISNKKIAGVSKNAEKFWDSSSAK